MAEQQNSNRKKLRKPRFYKRKGLWLALIVLSIAAGGVCWVVVEKETRTYRERAATYDLERINDLEIPSLIVDRNGKEIGRIFVQNRSVISIDDVPQIFIDALRAGEDQRFETHDGVDYIGIVRAGYLNWKASKTTQGASTITQQLARNAYDLEGQRRKLGESGIQRKLVEALLAQRIEKRYSKREILEFYLNRIYFGSGYYGVRSAALGYFGKEPRSLNALESAAIVGCIKNPSNLSPLNSPEANRRSRNLVLGRMVDLGALKRREAKELYEAPLKLNPKPLRRGTTHLYERIAEAVGAALGEDALASGGFTVHTTILAEAQNAAEKALRESLARAESQPGYRRQKYSDYRKNGEKPAEYLQGAVLMMDHETGEVLAHVGGRDYAQVPYDFIELGKRPLGTAFFPFIHAAALEQGLTPATLVEDEPMDNRSVMVGGREGILGEWGMEVPSPVYQGKIPLRAALEQSKIAATVRLADQTGLQRVVNTACSFGFPLQKAELLRRLAVGFEEVSMKQAVRAITAFSSGGRLGPQSLSYLERVESPGGRVVYRRTRKVLDRKQVIDSATAWQVHSMMAGSLYRGSSKGALDGLIEKPFHGAGKGGTTHDFGDCWFLGYNKRVTCGVWTGFLLSNGEPIYPGAFSRDLAMPVWQAAMNAAAPAFGGSGISPPNNVVEVPVCSVSGQRSTQFCQEYVEDSASGVVRSRSTGVSEYFRRGTEQLPFCTVHSGASPEASNPENAILNLPALDAVPVRPKAPVLLGDDPYHTELPSFATTSGQAGLVRRRTNVLDSLDLGDIEESIPLRRPQRLDIADE
ncbi:MAG: transglycosylase domain-containing protein [Luteolibacter sp.]|jgi:penicillin-binding protein 1A|nr:transglycosylase domain-containing protein [Luteolibacter sp.]